MIIARENTARAIAITANTSTSYVECISLSIVDLFDFYEDLVYYKQQEKAELDKQNNVK